ncbi:hypothetical protein [Streptomyces sp. NPDC005322]|uniref:hypothetical protein n=1 Tax=Streptomyces sp. NPDC005322 TaxID=3157032 RepID=UPI0033AC7BE6
MSTDEQAGPTGGSVPHAFRNALFWRWAPAMPKGLPTLFVTVLYALSAAADPAGRVRFRDGKAIRIKDIAAACKADEKDVRRAIEAAIAAGVVAIQGERRRGRPALYVLVLSPFPEWDAAVRSLEESKRKRAERKPPPWRGENGGRSPELSESENGGPPPELTAGTDEEERGTAPRMSSGDRPPFGSGDRPPNNPGIAKELPQDMAEVDEQPPLVGGSEPQADLPQEPHPAADHRDTEADPDPHEFARCNICGHHLIHTPGRPTRTTHAHCERRAEAERNAS